LRGAKDKPQGLRSSAMIHNWLGGIVKSAREDHYVYVLNRWRSLPDRTVKPPPTPKDPARISIPADILAKLTAERKRTRQAAAIFDGRSDRPDGFKPKMLSSWLSCQSSTAHSEHLAYALKCYAQMDTVIDIHDDLIDYLSRAQSQAGGQKKLLLLLNDPPQSLTAPKLSRIVNRYDTGIPEALALYLTKECERILADAK